MSSFFLKGGRCELRDNVYDLHICAAELSQEFMLRRNKIRQSLSLLHQFLVITCLRRNLISNLKSYKMHCGLSH